MKIRTNAVLAAALMLAVRHPLPTPPADGVKCPRCGEPMLPDALNEISMCVNPMCLTDHPTPGDANGHA